MTGRCTLHKAIIALHLKDLVRVITGLDKLAIDIGGNHKVFLALDEFQQMPVQRFRFRSEAGIVNVPGPVGPFLLLAPEWIERGCG